MSSDLLNEFNEGGLPAILEGAESKIEELEIEAASTGRAEYIFIAQTLQAIHDLHSEEDERGGVRSHLTNNLEGVMEERLSESLENAQAAKSLRDQVRSLIGSYDRSIP